MIYIKYSGVLHSLTGKKEETLSAWTIHNVLQILQRQYGKEVYLMAKKSHIIVNGENAGLHGGYRMKLQEKDVVHFVPVCAGG